MKVETLVVGPLEANCYILKKDRQALVIDPGENYPKIKKALQDWEVLGILITHCHEDHIGALSELLKDYPAKVYQKENLLEQVYKMGPFSFECIFTPGHTSDSVSFYFREHEVLFTGDFVFRGTVGRCDLPTGDSDTLDESIQRIKKYPLSTVIYSGHGDETTLAQECRTNPYF